MICTQCGNKTFRGKNGMCWRCFSFKYGEKPKTSYQVDTAKCLRCGGSGTVGYHEGLPSGAHTVFGDNSDRCPICYGHGQLVAGT